MCRYKFASLHSSDVDSEMPCRWTFILAYDSLFCGFRFYSIFSVGVYVCVGTHFRAVWSWKVHNFFAKRKYFPQFWIKLKALQSLLEFASLFLPLMIKIDFSVRRKTLISSDLKSPQNKVCKRHWNFFGVEWKYFLYINFVFVGAIFLSRQVLFA